MADIDIDTLFQQGAIAVNSEHPDERDSRLRIKEADATAARLRENIRFGSFSILLVTFIIGSAYFALQNSDPVIKHWCLATLTTIVSGGIGYLVGEKKGNTK